MRWGVRLSDLLGRSDLPADPEITGLTADSRAVSPGFLFAALPGSHDDGARFVGDARARGAAAVLCRPGAVPAMSGLTVIADADPRRALALAAARFHPRQPEILAGVTGTNGKTSVAQFTRQIWQALGHEAASLGTLGIVRGTRVEPLGHTTPDPVTLHAALDRLTAQGVERLVLEASSHGLDQRRLDGVRFSLGAFTNLTRDHLDYHPDFEAYLDAKARLFEVLLPPMGLAVIHRDGAGGQAMVARCRAAGLGVLTTGGPGSDLELRARRPDAEGQTLELAWSGRAWTVRLPLPGAFQADNALLALGIVLAGGEDAEKAVAALEGLTGVAGRMEVAARHPAGGVVVVDYAHTPDALATVLAALRPHVTGRLIVVFGCGGDRDPGKRAPMGEIATRMADHVIVTDDNPRTEDAARIRAAILEGATGAVEIADRAEAVLSAARMMGPGDVLLLAGKGHEQGQILGATVRPFDDRLAARAAVARLAEGAR